MLISISHADGISCESQIRRVSEELSIAIVKNSKTSLDPDLFPTWLSKNTIQQRMNMEKISKLTSLFGLSSIETSAGMPFRRRTSDLTWKTKKSTVVHKQNPECHKKSRAETTRTSLLPASRVPGVYLAKPPRRVHLYFNSLSQEVKVPFLSPILTNR